MKIKRDHLPYIALACALMGACLVVVVGIHVGFTFRKLNAQLALTALLLAGAFCAGMYALGVCIRYLRKK